MYLSRVMLNVNRRETMRALASPQLLHGAVEHSFTGNRQRKLWRVDWLGDNCYLLVLSAERPNFTHIAEEFGYTDSDGLKRKITIHYLYSLKRTRFGNSVCALTRLAAVSKKRIRRQGAAKCLLMLRRNSKSNGFRNGRRLAALHWRGMRSMLFIRSGKNSVKARTATARFCCVWRPTREFLTISDIESFKQTLLSGIGRAKAYGCGLLTIACCEDSHNE